MTSRIARSSQKLALQAMGQYGVIPNASGTATPGSVPDPTMYGVFAPAYAESLKAQNDPIRGPLSDIALRGEADDERAVYSQALKDSYLGSLGLAKVKNQGDAQNALIPQLAALADRGMSNGVTIENGQLVTDPISLMNADAYGLNKTQSEIRGKNASAAKDRREAGIETSPEAMAMQDTPANQTDMQAGYGLIQNLTPTEQTDRDYKQAEAASHSVSAGADATRAAKYTGGSESGGATISITPGMYGLPDTVTGRGKDPAKVREAIATATGQPQGQPQASPLATVIAKARALGANVAQQGANTIVSVGNSRRVYDANGNRIQ